MMSAMSPQLVLISQVPRQSLLEEADFQPRGLVSLSYQYGQAGSWHREGTCFSKDARKLLEELG
jgi:hypothetical protein